MDRTRTPAALALLALLLAAIPARAQSVTVKSAGPPPPEIADLLRPPGSDPYAPAVNWAEIPPWRQASFFDVRAQGTFFVFVVDCSGSMAEAGRLVRAKGELRRAIGRMQFPQRYLVIFYNDRPLPMPGGIPVSAARKEKDRTGRWLGMVEAEGQTDPRAAMRMALSMKPDAVYLLSDGEFPAGAADEVIAANKRKTPVHSVDLSGGGAGPDLKRISEASGGRYASRPSFDP